MSITGYGKNQWRGELGDKILTSAFACHIDMLSCVERAFFVYNNVRIVLRFRKTLKRIPFVPSPLMGEG
jgi:hypothetical protein